MTVARELHHSRHLNAATLHHSEHSASDRNLKGKVQRVSDTSAGKTCRHFDCLSCCLTLFFTQLARIALLLRTRDARSATACVCVNAAAPRRRLAVTTPAHGLLFGRKKTPVGRSYLDRLKNPCPAVYISQPAAHKTISQSPPTPPPLSSASISFHLAALPRVSQLRSLSPLILIFCREAAIWRLEALGLLSQGFLALELD